MRANLSTKLELYAETGGSSGGMAVNQISGKARLIAETRCTRLLALYATFFDTYAWVTKISFKALFGVALTHSDGSMPLLDY